MIKNLPAMRETWVRSLGWEDLLEKGMATHSVFLPGESPWTEEPDIIKDLSTLTQNGLMHQRGSLAECPTLNKYLINGGAASG